MAEQPPLLSELAKRLGEVLPEILPGKPLAEDLEKSAKAVAQSVFNRLELVTREEYDAQVEVLQRTRERLAQLETQLDKLTKALDTLEAGQTGDG
jgi:BMFP domain-containing protein YqiC